MCSWPALPEQLKLNALSWFSTPLTPSLPCSWPRQASCPNYTPSNYKSLSPNNGGRLACWADSHIGGNGSSYRCRTHQTDVRISFLCFLKSHSFLSLCQKESLFYISLHMPTPTVSKVRLCLSFWHPVNSLQT